MRITIRGGTASNGEPSLCLTCRFATVVKGVSLRDEIVECSQLSYGRNRITFPATVCTEYSDRRQPSLRAMEEIAWVLRSDPKKNEIGFVKRTELTRRERFVLDDDKFLEEDVYGPASTTPTSCNHRLDVRSDAPVDLRLPRRR